MQLITIPRFRAHNSLLDSPLYENTSTPYFLQLSTFLFLRHFRLVFAEMSYEIQRYLAAKSDVQAKKIRQELSKLRRMAELRLKAINATLYSTCTPSFFMPVLKVCVS
jgi:hypothetical protein